MGFGKCYILVEVTSSSFEIKSATLDDARAKDWEQQKPMIRHICEIPFLEDVVPRT